MALLLKRSVPLLRRCFSAFPAHTKVPFPALSPTMTKGTIAKWRKAEGDLLQPGDVLMEVETDKATVDFEMVDGGYLAKILVPEGSADVEVGVEVAIMVEEQSSVAAFKTYKAAAAAAAPAAAAPPAAAAAPAAPVAAAAPPPPPKAPAAAAAPASAATTAPKAAAQPPPAPAAAAATGEGLPFLAFEAWGSSLARSPLALALAKQQNAYVSAFGYTGFDPIPLPEALAPKKDAAAAGPPAKKEKAAAA